MLHLALCATRYDKTISTKAHPYQRWHPQFGLVRIYHKLKTAERFGMLNRSTLLLSAARGYGTLREQYACTRRWASLDAWRVRGLQSQTAGEYAGSLASGLVGGGGPQKAGALPSWKDWQVNGTLTAQEWVFCS